MASEEICPDGYVAEKINIQLRGQPVLYDDHGLTTVKKIPHSVPWTMDTEIEAFLTIYWKIMVFKDISLLQSWNIGVYTITPEVDQ